MSVLGLVCLMMAVSTNITGLPIGICILLIIIQTLRYNMAYVTVGDDYLSIKPAPARGTTSILFDEITHIEQKPKKLIIFYRRIDGKDDNRIVIMLNMMEDDDLTGLLNKLAPVIASKPSNNE